MILYICFFSLWDVDLPSCYSIVSSAIYSCCFVSFKCPIFILHFFAIHHCMEYFKREQPLSGSTRVTVRYCNGRNIIQCL